MIRILPSGQQWQTPTFVIVTMRDGQQQELAFSTRIRAEAFVYAIPIMAYYEPDSEFADIASAKLRMAFISIN